MFHCLLVFNNLNVKILHSVSIPSTLHFEDITHRITFLMRRRKASRADRQKFLPYMATCTEKKITCSAKIAYRDAIKIIYSHVCRQQEKKKKIASSLTL